MSPVRFAPPSLLFLALAILSIWLTSPRAAFSYPASPPDSLSSLVGGSSLVVVGTVGSIVSTYYIVDDSLTKYGPFSVRQLDLLSEVTGTGPLPVYVTGFPYFQQGRDYLVFLQLEDERHCPGGLFSACIWPPDLPYLYRTVIGSVGVFLINNGLLYGVQNPVEQRYWPIIIQNGTQLSRILSQIRSIDFSTKLPAILMTSILGATLVLADITTLLRKRREKSPSH